MPIHIDEELRVVGRYPSLSLPGGQKQYALPITPRENFYRYIRRDHPLWIPGGSDVADIMPVNIPDVIARGMVLDTVPFDPITQAGGKDMYGVDWVYVPQTAGSMVRPGSPMIEDVSEWKSCVSKPDIASWDWENTSERLRPYYSTGRANRIQVYTGLFERLISFMDFENAAIALIDDEEKPYVHELLDFVTSVHEELLEYLKKYLNIDIVTFHDDWGTQRSPFFALDTCREMLVPYLKRVSDKAHSLGMIFDFHSCGMNEPLVPAMAEAGVDMWCGQNLNDWVRISEKYGDKLFFDIVWAKYNPNSFSSKEEYLKQSLEEWKRYSDCPGIWMNVGRFYNEDIVGKFFEMTYPLSRAMLAGQSD